MKNNYITDDKTTNRMRRIKSKATKLEKVFCQLLRKSKIKFRSQPKLFGKPDFWIYKTNVVIFCDSSFWHGRRKKEISGLAFSRNRELWITKLRRNKERALEVYRFLVKQDFIVLRFWDDDILKNQDKVLNKITKTLNEKAKKRKSIYRN